MIPIDFSTDDTRFTFFYSIFSFFGIFRVISLNRSLSTIRLLSLLSYSAFSERVILNRIAKIPVHAVIVPKQWIVFVKSFLIELLLSNRKRREFGEIWRDFLPQLLDKEAKEREKKKCSFFFAFATANVFRSGILAEGRWDSHEETGSRATFQPANSTETSDGPRMIRDD